MIEIIDKSGRKIRLTEERWKHISKHPLVQNNLDCIKETLQEPTKITDYSIDDQVRLYYRYYKNRPSPAKYLRVIVRYLNGDGFIVTAHFVEKIQ